MRGLGRERPRPGTAPLPEQVGAALRKSRGHKDKGAARRRGEAGAGGQGKGGLLCSLCYLSFY